MYCIFQNKINLFQSIEMRERTAPTYKIKYRECKREKMHEGESLNFVCLHKACKDNSLICSMCRNEEHKSHSTVPLKFYLQGLQQKFQDDSENYIHELEQLQEGRINFLLKLKESVEKVAFEFQKIEQSIVEQFQLAKVFLLEEKSRKQKFNDFYRTLSGQKSQQAQSFIIQEYLPRKQVKAPNNFGQIQKVSKKIIYELKQLASRIVLDEKNIENEIDFYSLLKFPKSIVCKNKNSFLQSNIANNAQSIGMLKLDMLKEFQANKIKIKIAKLKKGGNITLGLIEKELVESLNMKAPQKWAIPAYNKRLFMFDNNGVVFGHSQSQLKVFTEGSNIQLSIDGSKLRIGMRKNSAQYLIPPEKMFYFFTSLVGSAEVQINFPLK